MARIAGVDLPPKKRAEIGLTYIYGIGRARSLSILMRSGIDPNKKIKDLTEEETSKIRADPGRRGSGGRRSAQRDRDEHPAFD